MIEDRESQNLKRNEFVWQHQMQIRGTGCYAERWKNKELSFLISFVRHHTGECVFCLLVAF